MLSAMHDFHDMRIPFIFGYMCDSSLCMWLPILICTGSLPMGVIIWPLTVRGVIWDGSKLPG